MPDINTALEKIENNEATNKEVASKLENQDQSIRNTPVDVLKHTGDALDELAAHVPEKKHDDAAPPEVTPKAVDKPDEKTLDASAPPAPDPAVEAARKRADEIFKDSPTLPSGASPKSGEAFTSVKIKAAQEISALEAKLEAAVKAQAELEAKLANPVPPETLKELEDHRAWRTKLDVELDPKFKEYDKSVSQAQEFIYSQLRKSPAITEEVIAKIKSHGGPENVQLEKIFASMQDPLIQRLVESKIADIEMAKFGKEQAIKAAKENVTQYLTERQKAWEASATAHNTATKTQLDGLAGKLEWLKPRAESGTDEEKSAAAEHNKFVKDVQQHLQNGLQDDSPEMRAIMLTGMAQLIYLQRVHAGTKAEVETEKKSHDETKKLLSEANAALEKFKKASVSRLQQSAAPSGGKLPDAKKDIDLRSAGQALDDIAKQVMEERRRTQSVG